MEILNKTNNREVNLYCFGIFGATVYGCSFLTDFLCIILITVCRTQLQSVEVYILLIHQVFTLIYKILSSILLPGLYFNSFLFGNQTCIWTYPFTMAITICLNANLVFFGLYHYSSINQFNHRSKFYSFTRDIKFFVVFTLITIAFSFTLTLCVFRIYRDIMITVTLNKCIIEHASKQIQTLLGVTIMPLLGVVFIYTVCIYKLLTYIRKRINMVSRSEKIRYRRLLKVSLKFLLFSLLSFSSCLMRFTFVAMAYFCTDCHPRVFLFLQFFLTLSNVIEPTLLIYIHKVLKKTLKLLLFKGLRFIRK